MRNSLWKDRINPENHPLGNLISDFWTQFLVGEEFFALLESGLELFIKYEAEDNARTLKLEGEKSFTPYEDFNADEPAVEATLYYHDKTRFPIQPLLFVNF